jgi:hypothetical protein
MKTIIVSMLVLSLFAAGAALGSETGWVFVGEDENGNVIILPLSAADHNSSCLLAAASPVCSNGTHTSAGGITHGFALYTGATGAAASILSHGGGARVFGCTFGIQGPITCQGGQGTFPAAGASFDHNCVGAIATASVTCTLVHN